MVAMEAVLAQDSLAAVVVGQQEPVVTVLAQLAALVAQVYKGQAMPHLMDHQDLAALQVRVISAAVVVEPRGKRQVLVAPGGMAVVAQALSALIRQPLLV